MTIVIALRCLDGLVMAADSQSTESAGNVRRTVDKIFPLSTRSVWGGSGSGQVIREM
jgi:proteasome beta subunit